MKDTTKRGSILPGIVGAVLAIILLLGAFNTWQVIALNKQVMRNTAAISQIVNFINGQIEASKQAEPTNAFNTNLNE